MKAAMAVAVVLCAVSGVAGCGALDVSDPTAIQDGELDNATGAALLRGAALKKLAETVRDGAYLGGLISDEFMVDLPELGQFDTWGDGLLDKRESLRYEDLLAGSLEPGYLRWQETRTAASAALPKLQAYAPEARVGEMLAVRGFASLLMAEDFCPGFPLNDMVDGKVVFGPPLSTEEALTKALADFDSAMALAGDSARILNLVQVGRGRTLLGLGRFDEAAAAVADVPTGYVQKLEYRVDVGLDNLRLFFGADVPASRTVADREGGTGLDFVAAADPRLELTPLGTAADGVTALYGMAKYPDANAPVVLASGIEARLIEAEAALHRGDPNWLTILNTLRTTQVAPALADTTDPGTDQARVDLLFRERAFWLFGTGHRLGDLRRLVRLYGRASDSVFPTGAYRLGGTYGVATSIPFAAVFEARFNPAVTGCTSR